MSRSTRQNIRALASSADWAAARAKRARLGDCPLGVVQHREVSVSGIRAVEGDENTFEVSFSSETPVSRWFADEILGHGTDAKVDLSPLMNVGSVLFNHDMDQPVAVPVEPKIDTAKRRGVARIRFVPDDPDSAAMKVKVQSGLVRGISVGYSVQKYLFDEEEDTATAVEWRVHEISLVTVPADASVGVGRSAAGGNSNQAIPGGVSPPATPRQGATAMSIKLKGGREISLLEYEGMRALGQRIELEDGTVIEARAVPVIELAEVEPQVPAKRGKDKPAKATTTDDDEDDPLAIRARFPEDEGCDPVEIKRRHDIRQYVALGRGFAPDKFPKNIEASFILRSDKDGKVLTAEFVRQEVQRLMDEHLEATRGAKNDDGTKTGKPPITGGADINVRSLIEALPDALMLRSDFVRADGTLANAPKGKPATKIVLHERANSLRGLKLMQMVRAFVEGTTGRSTIQMSDREVLKLAGASRGQRDMQGTSDFSTLLENALNKMIVIAYRNAASTYRQVARIMPASDLRAHNLHSFGGVSSLAKVADGAEVVRGTVPDSKKEIVTPAQFARIFAITDATFINDDIGALTSLPMEFGAAADTTVNEWFWYQFLQASGVGPTMNEDSVALFDTSGHSNYVTSGGAAPSATTFNVAYGAMMKKTGLNGKPLGALTMPKLIAIPPALRGTTLDFLATEYLISSNNKKRNIYFEAVEPVIEPLLELGITLTGDNAPAAVTGSATAWMLFADPAVFPTGVVAFYDGDTPKVVENRPIDMIGTEYRVQLDFGVGVANWRGAYKNDGD